MDNQSITINISLDNRNYRLIVEKSEEEIVRKASKNIDTMLKEYAKSYGYKDKQDLFAMVALQNTTAMLKMQAEKQETVDEIAGRLQQLEMLFTQ
jgi:cell division protein ZapA